MSEKCDGFINAAKEVFGKRIQIVVDRFHVAKQYGNGPDELRKKEWNRLVKKTLSKEDYKELKGALWILRKKAGKSNPRRSGNIEKMDLNIRYNCNMLID